jgi:hemerythrin-like domain-containing protein
LLPGKRDHLSDNLLNILRLRHVLRKIQQQMPSGSTPYKLLNSFSEFLLELAGHRHVPEATQTKR